MAPSDRVIAEAIIDAIEPSGMLTISTEDLWQSLQDPSIPVDDRCTHDDVCAVLARVQQFDPIVYY